MHQNSKPCNQKTTACRFGRSRKSPSHPTCRSCQRQGVVCRMESAKERKRYESWPEERDGAKMIVTSYDLQSMNKHVNKANGDQIYRGIKRTWQRMLGYSKDGKGSNIALLLFSPHKERRRRLKVVRYIGSLRSSLDETNLQGALKPIEDALILAGVLKDDNRKWLQRDPPEELVDKERPRVEIFVE